jgi:hypothetical protein
MPVFVVNAVIKLSRRLVVASVVVMARRECKCTMVVPPSTFLVNSTTVNIWSVHGGEWHAVVVTEVVGKNMARDVTTNVEWVTLICRTEKEVVITENFDLVITVLHRNS